MDIDLGLLFWMGVFFGFAPGVIFMWLWRWTNMEKIFGPLPVIIAAIIVVMGLFWLIKG